MSIIFDKQELKEAILSKAFRGELTEQNYEEESGQELLKRIRSEKLGSNTGKKSVKVDAVLREDEPYELPPNWTWTRLGEVSTLISGRDEPISQTNANGIGVPYIMGASNFKDGSINIERWIKTPKVISLPEDILITVKGTVGKMMVNKNETYNLSRQVMALRVTELKNMFVYYFLKHQMPIVSSQSNGVIPGIPRNVLLDLEFPIPPLAEQRRIVAKIERAFELIDSMDVDSLLQDISDFRQEILTRAFRGDLTEQNFDEGTGQELLKSIQLERQTHQIKGKKKTELAPVSKEEESYELPPNWTWTRLGEVVNGVEYGVTASASEESSDSKMIRITDISMIGKVDWSNVPYCHIKESDKLRTAVQDGDILVARTGATVGKSTLITGTPNDAMYVYASYLIRLKNIKRMNPRFTKLFMESSEYWTQIIAQSSGTGQPNVNGTKLSSLTIPLPPFAEQQRIVAKIEAIFSALDVMEDAITKQKDEAKACYEEILRKEMGVGVEDEKELENASEERVEVRVG